MKLIEMQLPIVVEPSQVYCKHDGKRCKNLRTEAAWCTAAFKDIPVKRAGWRAPDWCPLAFDALFPRSS